MRWPLRQRLQRITTLPIDENCVAKQMDWASLAKELDFGQNTAVAIHRNRHRLFPVEDESDSREVNQQRKRISQKAESSAETKENELSV